MQKVEYNQFDEHVLAKLSKGGLLLTSSYQGKTNTMTIGWGSIGFFWNMPVFTVPVRGTRFTHGLIDSSRVFTVTVPKGDELRAALAFCGSKSGRNMDKIEAANLALLPGQTVDCPVISNGWLHYECRVMAQTILAGQALTDQIRSAWYADNNFHTLFLGQIVDCYTA